MSYQEVIKKNYFERLEALKLEMEADDFCGNGCQECGGDGLNCVPNLIMSVRKYREALEEIEDFGGCLTGEDAEEMASIAKVALA